jgi:glycosyltransferase involved in cell wall biosynthesis
VFAHVLHPLVTRRPIVLGVADVSWRRFRGQYRTTFNDAQVAAAEAAIRRADHVLTLSRVSADEIAAGGYPVEKITIAPLAVADEFRNVPPAAAAAVRAGYGLPPSFVFYVGGINERKNVTVLVDAVRQLRPSVPLVIAGPPPAEGLGYWRLDGPSVRHLGYVAGSDLPGLYAAATVLVFPSKLEGFGLPLVEAAAVGVPVLAADTPVFREVGRGAVEYFDPGSAGALAAALGRFLDDPPFRSAVGGRCRVMAEEYTEGRYRAAVLDALTRARVG